MNQNQIRLRLGLFINYLVHGFGMIILTQNLISLSKSWHSSLATASFILSGIGIGRLIAYLLMGFISDKFGRKITLLFGMMTYLAFFILTPFNHSITLAYGLSIVAGIANSSLDSATYPLLAETSKSGSSSSVLVKAFISVGEFILPIIVLSLNSHQMWFGLSFMVPAAIIGLNLINLVPLPFPKVKAVADKQAAPTMMISKPAKVMATGALLIYGFTSMAVMIWFTQWITIFATHIDFNPTVAHLLLSLYSIGSISGVIMTVILLKTFNRFTTHIFVTLNIISTIMISIISFSHIELLSAIAAFFFGFSAAGGLMQIALNGLLNIYPKHKGLFTGIFFIFGSIASFSIPIVTGAIVKNPNANVMSGDIIIAIVGLVAALIVLFTIPNRNTSLADARKEINAIDAQLVKLLNRRFIAVNDVHRFKQEHQLAVLDHDRELQVLKNVDNLTPNKAMIPYNRNIMQNIMDNSRAFQNSLKNK